MSFSQNYTLDELLHGVKGQFMVSVCTCKKTSEHYWQIKFAFANTYEPPHDKTNKMTVRSAKTQISLGIRVFSTFRHLKQGIQDFHGKYVLVPADKAANNVVVA